MSQFDFRSPAGRLRDALLKLEQRWRITQEDWNDSVSSRVEEEYLLPLHSEVQAMLDTASRLAEVMQKAERACRHPKELH